MPVLFSAGAQSNLDEAACVFNARRQGLGETFVRAVRRALNSVALFPGAFTEVRPGVRRIVIRKYRFNIYYRPHADYIEVLAILHASRNPGTIDRA